jgi:hypothetical protein
MTATETRTLPARATTVSTTTLSVLALIGGIASIVFGQTVLIPIVAIVLGIVGYRQEPLGRTYAVWGIVLSALALFGWVIVGLVGLAVAVPFIWMFAF